MPITSKDYKEMKNTFEVLRSELKSIKASKTNITVDYAGDFEAAIFNMATSMSSQKVMVKVIQALLVLKKYSKSLGLDASSHLSQLCEHGLLVKVDKEPLLVAAPVTGLAGRIAIAPNFLRKLQAADKYRLVL